MQPQDKAPFLLHAFKRIYWSFRAARKMAISSLRRFTLSCRDPRVFVQAIRLYRQEGFEPQEALRLGLLNGTGSARHIDKFTSRKKLKRIQRGLW